MSDRLMAGLMVTEMTAVLRDSVTVDKKYKKCDKSFIRELCHCVGLSQEWEKKLIGLGEHNRSSMIQRVIEVLDDKQ